MSDYSIILTGASSGIGAALVELLADAVNPEGGQYQFTLISRREEKLREIMEANDLDEERCAILAGDVTEPATADRARDLTVERFGKIDSLVNNAGYGVFAPLHELTPEQFRGVMDVNVYGAFLMARAVVPHMLERESGAIVNISSVAGTTGFARGSVYNASKHAVEGMTKALAEEVRAKGVRACLVCPGAVATDFFDNNGMGEIADHYKRTDWMMEPLVIAEAIRTNLDARGQAWHMRQEIRPLRRPT